MINPLKKFEEVSAKLFYLLSRDYPIVTITLLFVTLVALLISDRDSTDSPERRSGLSLYTDHMTGCQYVRAGEGLTPRLGKDGKQICTKE